jgi:hypothetical protein
MPKPKKVGYSERPDLTVKGVEIEDYDYFRSTGVNNTYNFAPSGFLWFESIAELKRHLSPSPSFLYRTLGWWGKATGGGSLFYYSPTATGHIDDCTSIAASGTTGRYLIIPENGEVNVRQFGAIADNTERSLTTSYNGLQRFASLSAASTMYPPVSGTWFEFLSTTDTLDAVAIQAAYRYAANNRLRLVFPVGMYRVSRGVWLGEFEHGGSAGDGEKNFPDLGGFSIRGDGRTGRMEVDTLHSVNIYCSGDIANRYTLRVIGHTTQPVTGMVSFKCYFGNYQTTAEVPLSGTPAHFKNAFEALTDVGTGKVTVTSPQGHTDLRNGSSYLLTFDRTLAYLGSAISWHGDIKVHTNTASSVCKTRIYTDSSVLILRGEAQLGWSLRGFNLSGVRDWTYNGNPAFTASFALAIAHTTWNDIEFSDISLNGAKWGLGIIENNSENGEQLRVNRLHCLGRTGGVLWINGGQSYDHVFNGWGWGSFAELEPGDAGDRVAYFVGAGKVQGYTFLFNGVSGSFNNVTNYRNVLLKIKGLNSGAADGVITFLGARFEHVMTLVEAEMKLAWNHYQTISFFGTEVVTRGKLDGWHLISDSYSGGSGSGHTIYAYGCKFKGTSENELLSINVSDGSYSSIHFHNCDFSGWRGKNIVAPNVKFTNCTWTDVGFRAVSDVPQRTLDMSFDRRRSRAQSLQDITTPWIESGKTINYITNDGFIGQPSGGSPAVAPWYIVNSSGVSGQSFVDFQSLSTDPAHEFSRFSHGKGANAFKLELNHSLVQPLVRIDSGTPKIINYRAMAAIDGTVQFQLVNSLAPSSLIYDSIQVQGSAGGDVADASVVPQMIELSAPLGTNADSGAYVQLQIKAITGGATTKMFWQHAWVGAGNATYISTSASSIVSGGWTYWTAATDTLKVHNRLELPSRPNTRGYATSVPIYDIRAGDTYFDLTSRCIISNNGTGYFVVADDTFWSSDIGDASYSWSIGSPRYVFYNSTISGTRSVTLSTTNVPAGKRVSVYRSVLSDGSGSLSCNSYTIPGSTLVTFVFDGSTWRAENYSKLAS